MHDRVIHIGFLLLPDFTTTDLTAVVDCFWVANWLTSKEVYRWRYFSKDGSAVRSHSGFDVSVDTAFSGSDRLDRLFICASFDPKQHAADAATLRTIQRLNRFGTRIIGLTTGAELLAQAGLLDEGDAAIHWYNRDAFAERHPDVHPVEDDLATFGQVVTCTGGTAISRFVLDCLKEDVGVRTAQEVADQLYLPSTGLGRVPSIQSEPTETIAPAVRLMNECIEEPISCAEIGRRCGISQRRMERHFKKAYGQSPIQFYIGLRLARAHALLQETDMRVTDVAVATGFSSAEYFAQAYRNRFGRPPSKDRRQTVDAPVRRR
ncbi:MAG: helix-turn-helix domain-containing protein [Alphaproteobacteria bacterium]